VGRRPSEVEAGLKARGLTLSLPTVSNHLRALAKDGRATVIGKGSGTRYLGVSGAPSSVIDLPRSELFDGARS
jgi:hypothetical protein